MPYQDDGVIPILLHEILFFYCGSFCKWKYEGAGRKTTISSSLSVKYGLKVTVLIRLDSWQSLNEGSLEIRFSVPFQTVNNLFGFLELSCKLSAVQQSFPTPQFYCCFSRATSYTF